MVREFVGGCVGRQLDSARLDEGTGAAHPGRAFIRIVIFEEKLDVGKSVESHRELEAEGQVSEDRKILVERLELIARSERGEIFHRGAVGDAVETMAPAVPDETERGGNRREPEGRVCLFGTEEAL